MKFYLFSMSENPVSHSSIPSNFHMVCSLLNPAPLWEHCPLPTRVTYWSPGPEGQLSASFTSNALPEDRDHHAAIQS